MEINKSRSRRLLTALGALVAATSLALTGCGSADSEVADGQVVTHAMGETKVPANPQRIVVLDSPHLDALVALGITPAAVTERAMGYGAPKYLADKLSGVPTVGTIQDPDVDAIANLAPDLIIGTKVRHEPLYTQLSGIAPTVFSENSGTNWHEQANLTAAAVGKSAEMTELLTQLDTRAKAVGQRIGAPGKTVSMVRFTEDRFRLYGPETFSGSLLAQVGFRHPAREWNKYSMAELDPEQYEQINGDVVFHADYTGSSTGTTKARVTALWGSLPAVAGGRAYEVADDTWMLGIGVLGANKIIDDIERLATK
ncbi:iron siderophore-binding protein [Nocardia neocaledoniensis NBRC 108232]|uniref:Iron complex transport system substrate-binding protein n=1 Tax=Nocardia neocaledoniensis TaxID=236511 RepID=A0A317N5F7_9NOCA|nr:iron-siderophore ABC transporter substrate-binding protein [Nocardia neocaledoniensis]PWV70304.1 iron complex transport system substrate-binding protein [Nocardia neocaledoniensis]GEM33693.1 iron siderophore-binding protein [Nocardia neocaledoniensis NBRC 108232]